EHIKGKDNVAADALSRIEFQDIKDMANAGATILKMTTRSETRKAKELEKPTINESQYKDPKINTLKVYEITHPREVRKVPRLQFRLMHNNLYGIIKD